MIVKLLIEHHLEFLSLKGGRRGSSESTHVKMPHCWKSHALAQFFRRMWGGYACREEAGVCSLSLRHNLHFCSYFVIVVANAC